MPQSARRILHVHRTVCAALLVLTCIHITGCTTAPIELKPAPTLDQHVSHVAAQPKASPLPANWMHGGMMEIFVRAYADSNGDGIGDLRGLIGKLDYLQSLGVRGLWLMPIHPSEDGDHGYAVADYRAIAPEFGTLADFDDLLREAHARGIGIVLDYLINHSASTHPVFRASASSPENTYRNWFVWEKTAPTDWSIFGRSPWTQTANGAYLGQFDRSMPDWNFRVPEVLQFHQNNMRFWLNRGVDGFRFDAVAHLVENGANATYDQPENLPLMTTLRETMSPYPNRYLVVESTARHEVYGKPEFAGSAFAFGFNKRLIETAKGDPSALQALVPQIRALSPKTATLLANHDEFAGKRLWDQFSGDVTRYKLAATALLTLPGVPFLYYGEEIGMSAGTGLSGDPSLRVPMSWTGDPRTSGFTIAAKPFRVPAANVTTRNVQSQNEDPNSLLAHYRALLSLRNSRDSLKLGHVENAGSVGGVLSYERVLGNERTLVAINTGTTNALLAVPSLREGAAQVLLGQAGIIQYSGLQLPALGYVVVALKN